MRDDEIEVDATALIEVGPHDARDEILEVDDGALVEVGTYCVREYSG